MILRILSDEIAKGGNSSSSRNLAEYMDHENRKKAEYGMDDDKIPFYDHSAEAVPLGKVYESIDKNKGPLKRTEGKFFAIIVSFSDFEISAMGHSREETLQSIHRYIACMMDSYAKWFEEKDVKGKDDLLYFYTIHEFRDNPTGGLKRGLHVHVVVSRMDIAKKHSLSPMTTFKHGNAIIPRGFHRVGFYMKCEEVFDKMFSYQRPVSESFAYLHDVKRGSTGQRLEQKRQALKEQGIEETFTRAWKKLLAQDIGFLRIFNTMMEAGSESIHLFRKYCLMEGLAINIVGSEAPANLENIMKEARQWAKDPAVESALRLKEKHIVPQLVKRLYSLQNYALSISHVIVNHSTVYLPISDSDYLLTISENILAMLQKLDFDSLDYQGFDKTMKTVINSFKKYLDKKRVILNQRIEDEKAQKAEKHEQEQSMKMHL